MDETRHLEVTYGQDDEPMQRTLDASTSGSDLVESLSDDIAEQSAVRWSHRESDPSVASQLEARFGSRTESPQVSGRESVHPSSSSVRPPSSDAAWALTPSDSSNPFTSGQSPICGFSVGQWTFHGSVDQTDSHISDETLGACAQVPETLSRLYIDMPVWPLKSQEEASLLRYYVERLARDFDLTDPYRLFRNAVPQRAATCPLLLNAIFALSARHLSRVGNYDPLISNRYHQECLERVTPVLNISDARLDENLLASTIILRHLEEIEVPLSGCSPSSSQPHLLGSHAFIQAQRHATSPKSLRQAAFWVALRQEIYVAFVTQRSITMAFESSAIDWSKEATGDHGWSCRMVALCADIIRFCFGSDDRSTTEYDNLSNLIEEWHSGKSQSFTAVYFRENDDDAVFPDIWLLGDEIILGWQHYYIGKLLLCAHNPRVPRLGPRAAFAVSQMDNEVRDYVRKLCGIAISNPDTAPNFTYASMAVAMAGDKFTERRDQEALLHVLKVCDSQYAIPTGHTHENLTAAWGWTPNDVRSSAMPC